MAENSGAIAQLKAVDPDRRRAALFGDKAQRDQLLTFYAFHFELAKIPEWVSEPMAGMIRYQWWRDCIGEIYEGGTVRAHEVATPLADILRSSAVTRFEMDQLIDARQRDLEREPFGTIGAARDYAAETSGRLMRIAAKLCDDSAAAKNDAAISALGTAWGLIGMARSWRFYHSGILKGVGFDDVLIAADQTVAEARQKMAKIPSALTPALAYGALVPGFVRRMRRPNFDPLTTDTGYGALGKQLKLMQTALTGKY